MKAVDNRFDNVTLLITHYNRSESLKRLLDTFNDLDVGFDEIIVSDDCSRPEHLQTLQNMAVATPFQLISSEVNRGLGNNINKGQDAVKTRYTLYVQEDFIPTRLFVQRFKNALSMMEHDEQLDIVKFYAYISYPYLKPANEFGFSEMYLPTFGTRYKKIYQYTDHPHLRRSSFPKKFGKYIEGIKSDKTEYYMCLSFLQNEGKGVFYNAYKELFVQKNSADEPSTVNRKNWRNSSGFFTHVLRHTYRQIKYNYDILTKRFKVG